MSRPRKRLVAFVALAGTGVLAASVFVLRDDIAEVWHLSRIGSKDAETRRAALEGLRAVASGRSARALLAAVEEDPGFRSLALEALLAAATRMRPGARDEAALSLRSLAERGEEVRDTYRKMASGCPNLFPLLSDDLRGENPTLFKLAASILIDAWPRSRQAIVSFARDAEPRNVLAFLGHGFGLVDETEGASAEVRQAGKAWHSVVLGKNVGALRAEPRGVPGAREVALALLDHERPEVRATALGFLAAGEGAGSADAALAARIYAADPCHLVRRAALRIAAHARDTPGNLDLIRVWRVEPDPALRAAAILARDAWSSSPRAEAPELWDGALATWIPPRGGDWTEPWTSEERSALERILAEEPHPELRDAASMALAGLHAPLVKARTRPPARPDIEVREWTILRRVDAVAGDATALDRPEFLSGSGSTRWEQADDALFASRGAIFFEVGSSASLLVQLDLCDKLPLEAHPPRADYLQAHPGLRGPRTPEEKPDGRLLVLQLPTWAESGPPGRRVDWCGLRVGYEERLEPAPGDVPPGSAWDRLRKVPASPVSLRGATERFLFYGGRLGITSPVRAFREESSSRVVICVRPLDGMRCISSEEAVPLSPIPCLLVIEKAPGLEARGRLFEDIDGDTPPRTVDLEKDLDLDLDEDGILAALRAAVARSGLSAEEADPLIAASRKDILEAEGTRIAWVLPRWIHDAAVGLTVIPAPGKLARAALVLEEPALVSAESIGAEDRALLWEFEPGSREEVEAEFSESPLPPLTSEPLVLEEDDALEGFAHDISSDGEKVLLLRDMDHYIADLGARRLLRLEPVKGSGKPWWPALSADGKAIAFSAWKGDEFRVQAASLERETLHTIALDLPDFPRASISGDGRRLAVCGGNGGDGMHVLDLQTRRAWFVRTGAPQDSVVELSGDGRRATCVLAENVVVVDLETGATLDVSRSRGRDLLPSISRDGSRVAFVRTLPAQRGVWVADLESRSRTRVSSPCPEGQFPSISPDGNHVAFTSGGRLHVRDLRSGRLREIPGSEGAVGPLVSNGGRRVVYSRRDPEGFRVYLGTVDSD